MATDGEREAKVLIVEDDPLIALDLEDTFSRAGYRVTGMAHSVDDGLALIESDPPEAATLDYQLGRETSEAIAEALDRRAIPYCFISGRGDLIGTDEHPILSKPAASGTILRTVETLLRAA